VIHRLELSFRFRVCLIVEACRRPAQRCRPTSRRHEAPVEGASSRMCLLNHCDLNTGLVAYGGDRYVRFFEPGTNRALPGRHEDGQERYP